MNKASSTHSKLKDETWFRLNFLSVLSGEIFIISYSSVLGAPVAIASASFSLLFSLTRVIINKLLEITRNKRTKYNKTFMLAKINSNRIEILISQTLIDS